MSLIQRLLLAASTGILLSLSWPAIGNLTPLVFVALIPLLYLERVVRLEKQQGQSSRLFWWSNLAFLLFNLITTWWIWFASPFGAVAAILANSLLMTATFQAYHFCVRHIGEKKGMISLIFIWIGFEYLHLDWDLSWPWLTLGNVFADNIHWIQWYEYTGVFGGSLWVIAVNWVLYRAVIMYTMYRRVDYLRIVAAVLLVATPILYSNKLFDNFEEGSNSVEVVVVQPNIDPYNDKFGGMSVEEQVKRTVSLAQSELSPSTDLIVAPETALPRSLEEVGFDQYVEYEYIKQQLLDSFPGVEIIIGASTHTFYPNTDTRPTRTARETNKKNVWYDRYNTAVHMNGQSFDFYHKSKLVPGVEMMPFPWLFQHFQDFAFDLGGTTGSLGQQDTRDVFKTKNTVAAPVVCYESIYGDYVGEYVRNGASLITIITNDGWWRNTPGHRQHLMYAQLRAIEHRRSIARSANTGISCFISPRGERSQDTKWWEEASIKASLSINEELTVYSEYGDIIGRTSSAFGGLMILFALSRIYNKKR